MKEVIKDESIKESADINSTMNIPVEEMLKEYLDNEDLTAFISLDSEKLLEYV